MMARTGILLFAVWVALLATTPFWAENYIIRIAIMIGMFSTMAFSWNLIGGFTGYPSFATAAFFGLGCYAGALSQNAGVPMFLAWAFATLFVTVFAAVLGFILLRLRGHYFAIGSIALVELCRLVVSSWGSLTGGGNGLNVALMQASPNAVAAFFLTVMLVL